MSALTTTAIVVTTPEGFSCEQVLSHLRLYERVKRKVKVSDEPIMVKTRIGVFETTYHAFERAWEIINEHRTFRLVYSGGMLIRMDGDSNALKRWLLLHKLSM
jgi:hypothetical protein